MEILPNIHWVSGVWGGNVFLLVERESLTLVDSGLPGSAGKVLRYIRSLGRAPEELRSVIITHGHPDHYGGAARLRRETGAQVLVHRDDTHIDSQGTPHILLRGRPGPFRGWFSPRAPADRLLEDGETLPVMGGLQVLHTPGHTPGSICLLLQEQETLFTGDTLLTSGRRFSRPMFFPDSNVQAYWESVRGLADIEFQAAFPGHGRPSLEMGTQGVRSLLELYSTVSPRWWRAIRNIPFLMKFGAAFIGRQR